MFETPEPEALQTRSKSGGPPRAVLSIQLLRFIAAFAVVIFHSQQALSKGMYETLGYWFELGAAGVHVFFVISGFVIMHTSYGGGTRGMPTKRFLLRRFVRIFPIYWLCCLAYIVYQQTWGTGYQMPPQSWLGAFLLLPSDSSRIIGPGWTLSYELYFYICFAAILWLPSLIALLTLTGFFVLSIAFGLLFGLTGPMAIATNPLILEFCAGCWLGYLFVHSDIRSRALGIGLIILGVALFIAGGVMDYRTVPLSIMWGIPSIFLVAGCLLVERSRDLPKAVQRASHLGDSSYVLYLIHILVITIVLDLGLKSLVPMAPLSGVLVALIVAIVCAILAALIFEFIERPMLRWLRRNVVDRFSARQPAKQTVEALNP